MKLYVFRVAGDVFVIHADSAQEAMTTVREQFVPELLDKSFCIDPVTGTNCKCQKVLKQPENLRIPNFVKRLKVVDNHDQDKALVSCGYTFIGEADNQFVWEKYELAHESNVTLINDLAA